MSKEILPGFINQVQPPELPVFLAKIEPLTLIKNEPPESVDEIIPDIKDVDLVSYILPEDLIKSETTFETKHIESVETQVFVKTENAPFVKIENITESEILNKLEDTGNKGINKAKDQGVVEVQGKMYDRNLRYSCDNCAYKTCRSDDLKRHKIIHLKEEKIQYFYCHHCSHKTKRRDNLIAHISKHFRKGNVYYCDNCSYKTYKINHLKRHKIIHLKPGEIQYFYCYHCSHKAKHKADLKIHISRHFEKGNVPFHCYICNFVTLRRDFIITHIKKHTKFKSHEISCERHKRV